VNAFAKKNLGLVKKDEIFYAKAAASATRVSTSVRKPPSDGIHGATRSRRSSTKARSQSRPNVQGGDPFLTKPTLRTCLEAMPTGAIVGIQDMGAAGGLTIFLHLEMGGRQAA